MDGYSVVHFNSQILKVWRIETFSFLPCCQLLGYSSVTAVHLQESALACTRWCHSYIEVVLQSLCSVWGRWAWTLTEADALSEIVDIIWIVLLLSFVLPTLWNHLRNVHPYIVDLELWNWSHVTGFQVSKTGGDFYGLSTWRSPYRIIFCVVGWLEGSFQYVSYDAL